MRRAEATLEDNRRVDRELERDECGALQREW